MRHTIHCRDAPPLRRASRPRVSRRQRHSGCHRRLVRRCSFSYPASFELACRTERSHTLPVTQAEHRKRLRRFNLPGQARELTFSTGDRRPLLVDPEFARITLRAMAHSIPRSDFTLLAFVVMPEHVHLLLAPRPRIEAPDPKRLLSEIKRRSSYDIKRLLQVRATESSLAELTVTRRDRAVFRFWLPGGGYDRNLTTTESVYAAFDYIHNNTVKRGLCRSPHEYEWSSARQWLDRSGAVEEWMPRIVRQPL